MAEDEFDLSIPLRSIYEQFECPICLKMVENCHITPCGHNFCYKCISECLNRKHACPCCSKPTTVVQLVKNHHFDKLYQVIKLEKDEATKHYYENLIADADKKQFDSTPTKTVKGENHKYSPIENVFQQHMKKSLLAYEEYYQDIKMRFAASKNKLQKDYAQKMSQSKDGQLAVITVELDEKVVEMESNFEKTVQLLLASYEKYLQENLPLPSFLPVTVHIRIESKNIRFENIIVKPTDCIRDLKEILVAKLEESKNPMTVPFSPNNIFVLLRPFDNIVDDKFKGKEKVSGDDMELDNSNLNPDAIVLMDETKPIMQFKVQPGSEFLLKGEIHLLSDKPKQCFTAIFKKRPKPNHELLYL